MQNIVSDMYNMFTGAMLLKISAGLQVQCLQQVAGFAGFEQAGNDLTGQPERVRTSEPYLSSDYSLHVAIFAFKL